MKLKLPPKLKSPYTLAEWLDLDYGKDPKFTKALKFLNLALINLKRTRPPSPEAFRDFTEQTAYLIKRLKKMLGDKDMPEPVREFCESFFLLLKKWQKGAVKVQDILMEEGEEDAARLAAAVKSMQQAAAQAKVCIKNYTTLAQTADKALNDIAKLNAIAAKGVSSPKLDAAVEQVRGGKLLKDMATEQKNCEAFRSKLLGAKEVEQARALAKAKGDDALAAQIAACSAQMQIMEKLAGAVSAAIGKYAKSADTLVKGSKG